MPPSGKPDHHVEPRRPEILPRPMLLDRARGEEEDLVGCHRRAEERDREVPVRRRGFALRYRRRGGLVHQVAPVRVQREHTDGEDDQAQPEQAGDVLHDREFHPPDHHPHRERRDGYPHHSSDVGRQLQCQCDTADLGGQRHQVDEERCRQVRRGGAWAESFPDDLERGPTADGGHSAGHVGVEADAEHADRHDPRQRETEPRADDRVGDQITDIEETADGGEDPERDREYLAHQRYPRSNASADAIRSARALSGEGSVLTSRTDADAALS